MKKFMLVLCLISSFSLFAEESVIKQEVTGVNKQQLDIKELDTEELLLRNQNLESSSIEISGENFKENQDKIKVSQNDSAILEEELSKGVVSKSYLKYILGGIATVALIIAL